MPKKRILVFVILVLGQPYGIKAEVHSKMYNDDVIQKNYEGSKQTIHTLKGRFNEEAHRVIKCEGNKEIKKHVTPGAASNESRIIQTVNRSNDTDTDSIEMKVLTEMLKDLEDHPARRSYTEDNPVKSTSSKTQSLVNSSNFILDNTQKQFEFESLLIKNQAAQKFKYTNDDNDDDNILSNDKNSTRRLFPYNMNQAQVSRNYFNPFQNPPPRSYTPQDILNTNINPKIMQGNNLNKLNYYNLNANPDDRNMENSQLNTAHESTTIYPNDITSEYKDNTKLTQDIDDGNIDLFSHLNRQFSSEELKNLSSGPTKGFGISDMVKSNLMLIDHPRVCYACSSTITPSCWSPDRRTPTKYCRQDHNACLTKIYRHRGLSFVIRDCGNACLNKGIVEYGIHYRSCTICHSDLCNGAYSVQIYALNIIIMLLISSYFKITM